MIFSAFLDAIDRITVLVDKKITINNDFYMTYEDNTYKLDIVEKIDEPTWYKYVLSINIILNMTKDIIIKNGKNITLLFSGSFVRDNRFDKYYGYDGALGVEYKKTETTFRLWSPVAREISLEIIMPNGRLMNEMLSYKDHGLWEITLKGNYECARYRYRVRIFDEYKIVNDPYGISSDANGNYNYVVDVEKFRKFRYSKPNFSGKYTDAIIYEASIRDLTSKLEIEDNMQFKTLCKKLLTAKGKSAGLDYIASLGITHLQLMPIFDFYGISDKNPKRYYNWGYNPHQYFVPKGAYSSNPDDPYTRINELIELIDYCHAYGLLVNMDVVFNHVNDMHKFPFDILVPGYYFRTKNGYPTNVSGCGNDLATERKMCSRFIVDNLIYLTKTYHFSGFRFDLMGLLDIDTLNVVQRELKKIDSTIMLYGEGWNMPNTLPDNMRPHSLNYRYLPGYAFFNDRFRDFFKGSQWEKKPGFLLGSNKDEYSLTHLITGSSLDYYFFDSPSHSINYIECHDNYTFYDFAKSLKRYREKDIYDACRIGLGITILSLGIPFIHSGQEFLRTKNGVENSYNSGDEINGIDWDLKDSYSQLIQTLRDLITIRKEYDVFRLDSVKEITARVSFLPEYSSGSTYSYCLKCSGFDLIVIIKMKKERYESKNGEFTMIFDGIKLIDKDIKKIVLKDKGIYIFKRNY